MSRMICYCFGYTETDIRNDVKKNWGKSTILEQIVAAKKAEGCNFPVRIPKQGDASVTSTVLWTA